MKYARADSEKFLNGVSVAGEKEDDNSVIHQFYTKNVDNVVENCFLWWIHCGYAVDNVLAARTNPQVLI